MAVVESGKSSKPLFSMFWPDAREPSNGANSGASIRSLLSKRKLSLKTKGFLFVGLLLLYAVFLTAYIFVQQDKQIQRLIDIQKAYSEELELRQKDISTFNAIMALYADIESVVDDKHKAEHVRDHLKQIKSQLGKMVNRQEEQFPTVDLLFKSLDKAITAPGRDTLSPVGKLLDDLRHESIQLSSPRQKFLDSLVISYRQSSERLTNQALLFGLLGITGAAIIVGLFFSRLTHDLDTLKSRAKEMASAVLTEQERLTVEDRNDEVGQLSQAINRIALELDQREKELEIERNKSFHKEKMAAIGTLAAGIAHEVGNPIAAISALVHETRKELVSSLVPCRNESCRGNLDFILHHAERLATITREVSEFSTPQPSKRQLLDLNSLIRNASSLMKYDKRFRRVDLQLNLDNQLPAIMGMGDPLLQVIMNLLINAADALMDVEDRTPTITCSTYMENGSALLSVADNGKGMDKMTIEHAFEAFYTTKPAGKGTGLGLSLCHSVVENHKGTIEIDSAPGKGALVRIMLPALEPEQTESLGEI